MKIVLGSADWDMCLDQNVKLSAMLNEKGVPNWLDVLGRSFEARLAVVAEDGSEIFLESLGSWSTINSVAVIPSKARDLGSRVAGEDLDSSSLRFSE